MSTHNICFGREITKYYALIVLRRNSPSYLKKCKILFSEKKIRRKYFQVLSKKKNKVSHFSKLSPIEKIFMKCQTFLLERQIHSSMSKRPPAF